MRVLAQIDPVSHRKVWSRSCCGNIDQIIQDISKYLDLLKMAFTSWTSGNWQDRKRLREGYLHHYQKIRLQVPRERLLEFRSEDGWEPLCRFLGKSVPSEPYPYVNVGNDLFHMHYIVILVSVVKMATRGLLWLAPIAMVTLACLVYPKS